LERGSSTLGLLLGIRSGVVLLRWWRVPPTAAAGHRLMLPLLLLLLLLVLLEGVDHGLEFRVFVLLSWRFWNSAAEWACCSKRSGSP
jgi:hypothetical protein